MIFFISRYIFPYFIHNLYYGLLNFSKLRFLYLVALSEIPLTYTFIMLGNSFKSIMYQNINLLDVFYSKNFLLPLLIIIVFMLSINYIKNKF